MIGGGSGTDFDENTVAFTIGGNGSNTRGTAVRTAVAPANVFDLPGETADEPGFCLVETVTDMNEEAVDAVSETRATPVYTENFDALYGSALYATAYEPQTGSAQLTDVWGSYLENGGTVNFKKVEGTANTYAYDYSKGQKVNLAWPEGGKLLYFLQAPYATTKELEPKFYADGHIEFDYADPTTPVSGVIANGAAAQKDFLFTSKVMTKGTKDTKNHVLLYHALTGVKFRMGNVDPVIGNNTNSTVRTAITKVTITAVKSKGHCTIAPNYEDGTNTSSGNKSNKKTEDNAATKSAACSVWTNLDGEVTYVQSFDVKNNVNTLVNYTSGEEGNSNFAESFYGEGTAERNLTMTGEGSGEVMLFVPQELKDVDLIVDFTINGTPYQRKIKFSADWKAGDLHTYTLTVNKVDVSITDEMSEDKHVKSNVTITNSGNVSAYIRASYAIAWYYGYGDDAVCVAAWQGQGTFTTNGQNTISKEWILGEDGYYYYPSPIYPGRSTNNKLFDTFTAPAATEKAPFPNAHLEMQLLLQGVQYDAEKAKVNEAWGNVHTVDAEGKPTETTVVSLLSKTIEGSTNK